MSRPKPKTLTSAAISRVIYVDVSVWIALLTNEPSSGALKSWLESETGQLVTSRWSLVEVSSALSIKVRRAELAPQQAQWLGERFEALVSSEVRLLPLASADYDHAATMCRNAASGLRAGDALHLAVASRVRATHLITLDKVMTMNANNMGFQVLQNV